MGESLSSGLLSHLCSLGRLCRVLLPSCLRIIRVFLLESLHHSSFNSPTRLTLNEGNILETYVDLAFVDDMDPPGMGGGVEGVEEGVVTGVDTGVTT